MRQSAPISILLNAVLVHLGLHVAIAAPMAQLDKFLKNAEASLVRGDIKAARGSFNAALELARRSQDQAAQATARRGLARTSLSPYGEAEAKVALALDRGLHNGAGELADLSALADNYHGRRYYGKELTVLSDSLAVEKRLNLRPEQVETLEKLAVVQQAMGAFEEALDSLGAALKAGRQRGTAALFEVRLDTKLGALNAELGRYEAAESNLKAAIEGARRLRAQISPAEWAERRQRYQLALKSFITRDHTSLREAARLLEPSEEAATPDSTTPQELADPDLLRPLLEAMAEDAGEQIWRAQATDHALVSLEKNPADGSPLRSNSAARVVWENAVEKMREAPVGSAWYKTGQDLVVTAAAFNRVVLKHLSIDNLPDAWYELQALQLSQLRQIDDQNYTLDAQQIAEVTVNGLTASWRAEQARQLTAFLKHHGSDAEVAEAEASPGIDLNLAEQENEEALATMESHLAGIGINYRASALQLAAKAKYLRASLSSGKLNPGALAALAELARMNHFEEVVVSSIDPAFVKETASEGSVMQPVYCELDALATLGRIYQALGRPEEARVENEQAWNLQVSVPTFMESAYDAPARKLGLPINAGGVCSGLSNRHELTWDGDFFAAEGKEKEALQRYLMLGSKTAAVDPVIWQRVASLYAKRGDSGQAVDYYRKAIDATEAIQGHLRLDDFVASWSSHQEPLYAQAIRLLYDLQRPEDAFEYAERARARAFLNQIGNRRLPATGVPPELKKTFQEVRQRLIELEGSRDAKGGLQAGPMAPGPFSGLEQEEDVTRKDFERLLAAVRQANPEYASLVKVDVVTLPELQAKILDADTTLIEYFVLDDKTLAWVVDSSHVNWLALPISATNLRQRIGYLRDLIAAREPSQEVAAELHATVFAPLEPYLHHSRVIIVPHGPLHFLPFGALWNTARGRYVAEDYALTLAPSASVLRFIRDKIKPATGSLLALGNPDGTLPHAEQEVREIARLFNASPRIGQAATKSSLFREGASAGIVHLAAHATYDPLRPLWTHIDLAADRGAAAPDPASDGRLHVYEIYDLSLKNANLVVLSACSTALGRRDEGDDLVGLPRAFLYAGTAAVLTTLWPVDDAGTGVFMQDFYRKMRQGMAAAEALRAAQRDLLQQPSWREPYYWAAFTLTGS